MNKKIIMVVIEVVFVLILFSIFVCLVPVVRIGQSQSNNSETLLDSSVSPNGEYTLEAYKTEPGATVDFSVKVYLIEEQKKILIYNAYHEYEATITWVSNDEVMINGKMLNLSRGETYDWRTY